MSLTQLLRRIIESKADPVKVAVVRIVIGINTMICALDEWRKMSRVLAPGILPLPVAEWLPRLSLKALPFFIGAWVAAAISFTLGWKTRIAGTLLFCVTGYTLFVDQQTYSNHLYLLMLIVLLLTLADSGAAFSLDAQGRSVRPHIPAWPLLLLQIQLSIVYGFSAFAKISLPYLSGTVLSRSLRPAGFFAVPHSWRVPAAMSFIAVTSIVFELFLAVALWFPRLRLVAVVAGVLFHAVLIATLNSHRLGLAIFAVEILALYLLFLDVPNISTEACGSWLNRLLKKFGRRALSGGQN